MTAAEKTLLRCCGLRKPLWEWMGRFLYSKDSGRLLAVSEYDHGFRPIGYGIMRRGN